MFKKKKQQTFTSLSFGMLLFCASRILDQLQNFDEVFSENVVLCFPTHLFPKYHRFDKADEFCSCKRTSATTSGCG